MPAFCRKVSAKIAAAELPLARPWIVGILFLWIFGLVSGSMTLKVFEGHDTTVDYIKHGVPEGVEVRYHWNDVKIANALLFVGTHFFTLATSKIIICFLNDIFHVLPAFIVRRLRIDGKKIALTTLPYQIGAIFFGIVCTGVPLGFMTFFTYTRGPRVELLGPDGKELLGGERLAILGSLAVPMEYKNIRYIRNAATVPWAAVFFGIIALGITTCVWRRDFREKRSRMALTPPVEVLEYRPGLTRDGSYDLEKVEEKAAEVEVRGVSAV